MTDDAATPDAERRERTRRTARMLFHTLEGGTGFDTWKRFDRGLARELSMFFTATLYSREVISQKQRELCAVASLTVLHRPRELHAHVHAALNVGATRREVAEVIFQQVTYGGMPVVVEALDVYARVLRERGEPFPDEEAPAAP
jgi:4-carboxymuconolactone decarboxylase